MTHELHYASQKWNNERIDNHPDREAIDNILHILHECDNDELIEKVLELISDQALFDWVEFERIKLNEQTKLNKLHEK